MKFYIPIIAFMLTSFGISTAALAQELASETPRAIMLERLGLNEAGQISQTVLDKTENEAALTLKTLREQIQDPDENKPRPIALAKTPSAIQAPSAPFYVTAQEYIEARTPTKTQQTILEYKVTRANITTGEISGPNIVTLRLGPKFASIERGGSTKIYDFLLNRIVTITPYLGFGSQEEQWSFSNNSLYAKVYRDITTVKQVTQGFTVTSIPLGPNTSLDAFWIESAMSWPMEGEVSLNFADDSLEAKWRESTVFKAKFDGKPYNQDSFIALAHLEWPIHSNIIQTFSSFSGPPKIMEIVSYGPKNIGGQNEIWTLVSRRGAKDVFPLPAKAVGITQRKPVAPLVFVINEAVHNRALGGLKTQADLDKYFTDSYQTKTLSLEALKEKLPSLNKKDTPALVLRQSAIARAQLGRKQAIKANVPTVDAEALLQLSLIKDPYDPHTYVGLAQVLAAKGSYIQSWDIYDTLRAGIPTAGAVDLKINTLEEKLKTAAPYHFLNP